MLIGVAHAQFLGFTSVQTTTSSAFTAQAANGVSNVFQNIGQSSHLLSYCPTNFIGTISMEASNDGTYGAPITLAAANFNTGTSTCRTLPAGGYYPSVRARVSNYAAGSITALYTGTAAPLNVTQTAINSNGPTSPVQCDQDIFQAVPSVTTSTFVTGTSNQTIWVCSITIGTTAAPSSSGTIQAEYGTGTNCNTGTTILWAAEISTTTPVQPFFFGGSFGAMLTIPPGQNLCFVYNAGSTAGMGVSLSFAQGFHNP
jgi:hypothetical protein